MHIGLLAAAAHAATTSSRFTIFYNPRASPSEFVISLAKYAKAVYHTHVSVGMRFRMLFETEEASVRRYMGTITGISDLDPVRWSDSYWRSVKVGWDESTAGERQPRVSLWDIEPLTTFPMYPSPFSLRLKRPWPPGLPFLHGGRDDEMGLKSPLMWLHGDGTDRGMRALNFKDMGVTPWTQPRFDSSLLGLQHEVYQAVGAAALQEMRNVDLSNQVPLGLQPDLYQAMGVEGLQEMRNVVPMKQALPSLLQFQQPHTGPNGCAVLQRQILQQVQSQSPQIFLQNILENQNQAQSQLHLIQQLQQQHTFNGQQQHTFNGQQQQLQHHSFNGQQQQLQHTHSFMDQKLQTQQQLQLLDKKQLPTVVTSFSQLASASQSEAPSLKSISSIGYQQLFPGCNDTSMSGLSPLQSIVGSFSPGDTAHLHNLPRTSPPIPSSTWLQKEAAVDSLLPSGPHPIGTQMDLLDPLQLHSSHHSMWLPPLPGRECSLDQESGTDPTQSNLLFGVSIDSASLLMQNGISSLRSVGSETDSTSMPFAASNYLDGLGSDFSLNPATNSSCLGESGIFQSPEHVDQENPPSRTFVKVYKSGSFGRSLDMTKFSSYQELRNELAQMFSLEGQLEDPQRSGWQLVFVDRENDVLLLGDDPWQEFVDNVWCIKILSPQEVQHMAKQGIELLSAVPIQRLASRNCNDHVS